MKNEDIGVEAFRPAAADRDRKLFLLHQGAMQARGMAAHEDGLQDVQCRLERIGGANRMVGTVHQRI